MRSRQVKITAVLGAITAAAALAGCSTGKVDDGTSGAAPSTNITAAPTAEPDAVEFQQAEPGSGAGIKIGLIALDDKVPFSKLVSDSVRKQASQAGAQLVYCDSKGDGATALACARNFKVQGVQGYLNFQSDAKSADAICAAGPQVPVIAIDIEQGSCQTSFMGANNEYAGFLAGQALGTYMKDKFNCEYDAYVSMEQPEAGAVNAARMGGYRNGFTSVCGEIKNLKTLNAFRIDMARTAFTDVLTTLPGAHRIVVAAHQRRRHRGRARGGQDGRAARATSTSPARVPTRPPGAPSSPTPSGSATPRTSPSGTARSGCPTCIKAIKGEKIPEKLLIPHQIVNSGNIDSIYHPTC